MRHHRFLLLLALLLVSASALAEDPTAQAREAFVRGTELGKRGSWREALAAYESSAALKPHPVTTYNIGYCERALGHRVRAWVMLGRALEAHAAPDGERLPPELVRSAEAYRAELRLELARVELRLPAGAKLTVDGAPPASLGDGQLVAGLPAGDAPEASPGERAELWLEPGARTFVIAKPGSHSVTLRRELGPGQNEPLVVELVAEAAPAPAPAPRARAPEPTEPTPAPAATGADYTWPIVAYGVGAAGIGVGTVFGLRALDEKSELEQVCPNHTCDPRYQARLDRANRDALISNVGFGVGLAGVALGTYLLLDQRPAAERRTLAAEVGLGWAGVKGAF